MRRLSLRPYPGIIKVCENKKEYKKQHRKLFGYNIDLSKNLGRMDGHGDKIIYLVWGCDHPRLVHEISHVLLHVFEIAGIDPREANGEPFCYMLSQLLLDLKIK